MPSGYIDIKSSDNQGSFKAYFTSRPYVADLPRPAGIVIAQEIFGVSPFLKEMANRYAALALLSLYQDLFWRHEDPLQSS